MFGLFCRRAWEKASQAIERSDNERVIQVDAILSFLEQNYLHLNSLLYQDVQKNTLVDIVKNNSKITAIQKNEKAYVLSTLSQTEPTR